MAANLLFLHHFKPHTSQNRSDPLCLSALWGVRCPSAHLTDTSHHLTLFGEEVSQMGVLCCAV